MKRLYIGALLVALSSLGAAWLVRPNGTGDVERTQAMTILGLNESDPADQLLFRSMVVNKQLALHLVRDAVYDVPCTKDGTNIKWFTYTEVVDADLLYHFNGITKGVKIDGFGPGYVQNKLNCPGSFYRIPGGDDYMPAVMVAGSQVMTINGQPIEEPMRLP